VSAELDRRKKSGKNWPLRPVGVEHIHLNLCPLEIVSSRNRGVRSMKTIVDPGN
jgi:hypothetical protein